MWRPRRASLPVVAGWAGIKNRMGFRDYAGLPILPALKPIGPDCAVPFGYTAQKSYATYL